MIQCQSVAASLNFPAILTFDLGFLKSLNQKLRAWRIITNKSAKSRVPKEKKAKLKREVEIDNAGKRIKNPPVLEKEGTKKLNKFWSLSEAPADDTPEQRPQRSSRQLSISSPTNLIQLSGCTTYPNSPEQRVGDEVPDKLQADPLLDLISKVSMDSHQMGVAAATAEQFESERQKRAEDAQEMHRMVLRMAERANTQVPPYEFLELIGKGSSGRVYKCKKTTTGEVVAVKIVNIDDDDFEAHARLRDDAIKLFRLEVATLQQLKDSKAKNVNLIHDAFDLHNQLWIISDYCTGGSIRTLMRANPPGRKGLEERFIIAIARELAMAMKSVHEIGVIHRDIKCTNVYVNEQGNIQLGDYGIVGELGHETSKRNTVIGTPHYIAPNVWNSRNSGPEQAYGMEVDVWAYGCTVHELATGYAPFITTDPEELHKVNAITPRLDSREYGQALCDFVAFCLNPDPEARPSSGAVLNHPYIAGTVEEYPTSSLVELIERYLVWECRGGQRQSLWMPGGAAPPSDANADADAKAAVDEEDDIDWNFNTSDNFNLEFGKRYSQMVDTKDFATVQGPSGPRLPPINTDVAPRMQALQEHFKDLSATRGEKSLVRVFDPESEPYELHDPLPPPEIPPTRSDLPFRSIAAGTNIRESTIEIDLDSARVGDYEVTPVDFGDVPTLKAKTISHDEDQFTYRDQEADKRATLDWTFPSAIQSQAESPPSMGNEFPAKRATMEWTFQTAVPAEPNEPKMTMKLPVASSDDHPPGFRPTLKHMLTEPVGQFRDHIHTTQPVMPRSSSPVRDSMASMIDLDFADPASIERPGTASSNLSSTNTELTSGNPFDLDDDAGQNEQDRNRFSYHKHWQSEGGQMKRLSHKSMQMHSRGNSLNDTDSDTFESARSGRSSHVGARRMHPSAREPSIDTNQWPSFGPHSSLDEEFHGDYGTERSSAAGSQPFSRSRNPHTPYDRPEMDFPMPEAPHPDAMTEDAEPALVSAELDRMLADLDAGLRAASGALYRSTGIGHSDESSDNFSGMERSDMSTDEDGF